jgi:7-cyano-7-deazaguanine synthase
MKKAYVLLSGGIDSTTALHIAGMDLGVGAFEKIEAISLDYGQRHYKEAEYAAKTCKRLGVKHSILSLAGVLEGKGVMLTDASVEVPNISYSEIQGVSPTYVPNRNMVLLSVVVAQAQKWVNEQINQKVAEGDLSKRIAMDIMKDSVGIYFGAHAEDAANWAYPDCTPEFNGAMANAIYTASYYTIRLHVPLQWMGKEDIIRLGTRLGVEWKDTWSCYRGEELHCGTCPTCRARKDGFAKAGLLDPTKYTVDNRRKSRG